MSASIEPNWVKKLDINPLPFLLESNNPAIVYLCKRDLLDEKVEPVETLCLHEPNLILKRQQPGGFWKYNINSQDMRTVRSYNLLETYHNLGILVEKYGFNKKHPAIIKTRDFIYSFQSQKGDLRGIYGNQYSPNYTAGLIELLIKCGFEEDEEVNLALDWLFVFVKMMVDGLFRWDKRRNFKEIVNKQTLGLTLQNHLYI
jgi:hypothetical protein